MAFTTCFEAKQNGTARTRASPHRCGGRHQQQRRHSAKQTKWTFPAPNSIEFGVGKVHFGTERDTKSPRKKLTSISPCFWGLKIKEIAVGKQPTKKWRAFPPFRGFKIDHSDRQATRKTPPQKMSIVLPLLQGNNRRNLSHVRRTLVWGLNSRKILPNGAALPQQLEVCHTKTQSVGDVTRNARKGL